MAEVLGPNRMPVGSLDIILGETAGLVLIATDSGHRHTVTPGAEASAGEGSPI
jgi:hypothetical protein